MNSEFNKLKKSVLSLVSQLPKDDIRVKLLITEYILSDYDFFEDSEEIVKLVPVDVLNNYLETFYIKDENEKLYSEWFAILSLYFLEKIDEKPIDRRRLLNFSNHAYNQALKCGRRASRIDEEIKRRKQAENKDKNIKLNIEKHKPNRLLKKIVFREYKVAYKQLKQEGKRVTYDAIAKRILPIIEKHNIHPNTGEKIIGRDKKDGTPGDVLGTLVKWFSEGVRKKLLKSPRIK